MVPIKRPPIETYPLRLLQLLVELVEGLGVFLPNLDQLLLVNFGLIVQSPFEMCHLGLTLGPGEGRSKFVSRVKMDNRLPLTASGPASLPELLLSGGGVQSVLQLGLEGLQLFSQVPAVFLCLGTRLPLQLQVLLQLRELSLHLSDLFLRQVLLRRLLLDPNGRNGSAKRRGEWA